MNQRDGAVLFSCAFAGSAFYRKVEKELRGYGELRAGEATAAKGVTQPQPPMMALPWPVLLLLTLKPLSPSPPGNSGRLC